ncbi:MAG: leucine-rich repeat protein [Coprobacillaceae bacterium]
MKKLRERKSVCLALFVVSSAIFSNYYYTYAQEDLEIDNIEDVLPNIDIDTNSNSSIQSKIQFSAVVGEFQYSFETDTLTATITGHKDWTAVLSDLTIPETVEIDSNTYTVTAISPSAFSGQTGITGQISIPNTIKTIGNNAFRGCTGLTGTLVLPNNLISIGSSAFQGCTGLTGNLIIPNSVITMESQAFYGCTGFNGTLTLSNQLTSISSLTFNGCTGIIGDLVIPDSVINIQNSAFRNCSKITSVVLPENLVYLGEQAFRDCVSLDGEVMIPETVTSMGAEVFLGCNSIDSIIHKKIVNVTGQLPLFNASLIAPDLSDYEIFSDNGTDETVSSVALKWKNEEKTDAELRLDYGEKVTQKYDFIFVVDNSGGLLQTANTTFNGTNYTHSRSFFVEDIVKDAIKIVLDGNDENYDNRVAITSFGGNNGWNTNGFSKNINEIYNEMKPVTGGSAISYTTGLQGAIDLVNNRGTDDERIPVIIMISGSTRPDIGYEGLDEAQTLRDMGVNVYPIAAYGKDDIYYHLENVSYNQSTCYDGYDSTAFEEAMGQLLEDITSHTVNTQIKETLDTYFDLTNIQSIEWKVSEDGGTAIIDKSTGTIDWILSEVDKNQVHTLTVDIKLKKEIVTNPEEILEKPKEIAMDNSVNTSDTMESIGYLILLGLSTIIVAEMYRKDKVK